LGRPRNVGGSERLTSVRIVLQNPAKIKIGKEIAQLLRNLGCRSHGSFNVTADRTNYLMPELLEQLTWDSDQRFAASRPLDRDAMLPSTPTTNHRSPGE
jgi:hypothetical protein